MFTAVGGVLGCVLTTTVSSDSFFSILTGVVSLELFGEELLSLHVRMGPHDDVVKVDWRVRGLLFKWGLGVLAQGGVEATTYQGVVMFTFSLLGGGAGCSPINNYKGALTIETEWDLEGDTLAMLCTMLGDLYEFGVVCMCLCSGPVHGLMGL